MRKRALSSLLIGAAVASFAGSGSASAQAIVDTFGNFAWRDISVSDCISRAGLSVDAATSAFAVADVAVDANSFRVRATTDDLNVFIYCFGDDDTTALDGPGATRVMVSIYVSTLRGTVGGQIRDFLAACMETGTCPPANAPVRKP